MPAKVIGQHFGHVPIARLANDDRVRAYKKQNGGDKLTPKQVRRLGKKTAVNLYRKVCIGCKKTYRKCDCPF